MGGVSTSVHDVESKHVLKVAEGTENDEFIITRHSQFKTPINIINVYGETESRCSENEVKDRWDRILMHLSKIRLRKEEVILIGD